MCEEEAKVLVLGAWGSPFTRRVELGLRLKGVAYGYSEEDFKNKSSLLLESNPVYKKAPVFIHGGKAIAESLVILEYIEDTWDGYPLLPKDPFQRAKARFLAKFIDEKVILLLSNATGRTVFEKLLHFLDSMLVLYFFLVFVPLNLHISDW